MNSFNKWFSRSVVHPTSTSLITTVQLEARQAVLQILVSLCKTTSDKQFVML